MEPADQAARRDPQPLGPGRPLQAPAALTQLFGFAQLDFAGALGLADGRYLARQGGEESVLVVETLGAPPPPRRRRRRPRPAEPEEPPAPLPLTRVTAVRAAEPFGSEEEAAAWLERASADEEGLDALLAAATRLLNRALHARAAASADPHLGELGPERAVAARIGFGGGDDVAAGRFAAAREVDPHPTASSRRRRAEALGTQQRVAAVLGGRERVDACETLLLRARADLDAGRDREAALQLRAGLDAVLAELRGALADPGHEEDMATLEARRAEADAAAAEALRGDLGPAAARSVGELLETCERVLRRRRIKGP